MMYFHTGLIYVFSCRVNIGIVEKNYNLEIWKLLCGGEIDHKTTSQQRFHGGNIKKIIKSYEDGQLQKYLDSR